MSNATGARTPVEAGEGRAVRVRPLSVGIERAEAQG